MLICLTLVRRQEPYFEPPSKAEDANSPVGPLQHHVAEPDLVEWENIDWSAINLGADSPNGVFTPGSNGVDVTPDAGLSTQFSSPNIGATDDHLYDIGFGYGFECE